MFLSSCAKELWFGFNLFDHGVWYAPYICHAVTLLNMPTKYDLILHLYNNFRILNLKNKLNKHKDRGSISKGEHGNF